MIEESRDKICIGQLLDDDDDDVPMYMRVTLSMLPGVLFGGIITVMKSLIYEIWHNKTSTKINLTILSGTLTQPESMKKGQNQQPMVHLGPASKNLEV